MLVPVRAVPCPVSCKKEFLLRIIYIIIISDVCLPSLLCSITSKACSTKNSKVKIQGSAAELLPRSVAPQHLEHAHLRSRDAPEMYSTRDLAARVSPTCAPATARSARACGSRVAGPPPPPARAAPRARRRSPIGSKERAPRQRDGRRHLAASRRRHPIAARPADLDVPKATPRRLGARVGQVATVLAHVPRRVHMVS